MLYDADINENTRQIIKIGPGEPCVKIAMKWRMVNWKIVCSPDPTATKAVDKASISNDFDVSGPLYTSKYNIYQCQDPRQCSQWIRATSLVQIHVSHILLKSQIYTYSNLNYSFDIQSQSSNPLSLQPTS